MGQKQEGGEKPRLLPPFLFLSSVEPLMGVWTGAPRRNGWPPQSEGEPEPQDEGGTAVLDLSTSVWTGESSPVLQGGGDGDPRRHPQPSQEGPGLQVVPLPELDLDHLPQGHVHPLGEGPSPPLPVQLPHGGIQEEKRSLEF